MAGFVRVVARGTSSAAAAESGSRPRRFPSAHAGGEPLGRLRPRLVHIVATHTTISETTRLAVATGFGGAYTTFLTYMYESNRLRGWRVEPSASAITGCCPI